MPATYETFPKRILVIDDDIDLLMLLERWLDKQGFLVETAVSLKQGEEILSEFEPDLLLLDINVNGEDGRKLSMKLKMRDETKDIKVIMMSGYDYSISRAVLFGADELLAKPLSFDFLLARIEEHLKTGSTKTIQDR